MEEKRGGGLEVVWGGGCTVDGARHGPTCGHATASLAFFLFSGFKSKCGAFSARL